MVFIVHRVWESPGFSIVIVCVDLFFISQLHFPFFYWENQEMPFAFTFSELT